MVCRDSLGEGKTGNIAVIERMDDYMRSEEIQVKWGKQDDDSRWERGTVYDGPRRRIGIYSR